MAIFAEIYICCMEKRGNSKYIKDQNTFIFDIRSSNGYLSSIAHAKKVISSMYLRHSFGNDACLMFGVIFANDSGSSYDPLNAIVNRDVPV